MNILPALRHSHEHNECVDRSATSKSDWLNSLHRGCLTKDTSDRYRLYSHLRALPSRKLLDPYGFDEESHRTQSHLKIGVYNSTHTSTENVSCDEEDEAELSKLSVSPVFREDSTRPPEACKEITPELFTVNEFFNYVWSDNWREEIYLRVVGGNLLKLLLTALYDLEQRQKLNSLIIHANLNNIRKYAAEEELALHGEPLNRMKLSLPLMPHLMHKSPSKKRIGQHTKRSRRTDSNEAATLLNTPTISVTRPSNESLSLRQDILDWPNVGKPQLSTKVPNTPVISISRRSNESRSVRSSIKHRDAGNAHKEMRCESMVIRLILYEKAETSNVTYIMSDKEHSVLQSDEQIPLPRHVLYPAYSQAEQKMNYVRLPISEDVDTKERIATLTSELDDMLKITTNTNQVYTRNTSVQSENIKEKSKLATGTSDTASIADKHLERHSIESVTDDVWYYSETVTRPSETHSRCNEERSEESSSSDRVNSLLSLDDTDTLTYKKLNLSRKEMYITGLYVPRTENKIPAEVKLQRAKTCKSKMYPDNKAVCSGRHKLPEVHNHSIHISLLKENIHTRSASHSLDAQIAKKGQVEDYNVSEKLWSQYIKEQETMEMEMALNNNLAVNIIDRLQNTKRHSSADRTLIHSHSKTRNKKAKRLYGKTIADALSNTNDGNSPSQKSSRRPSSRFREEAQLLQDIAPERQLDQLRKQLGQMHPEMNLNSNAIVNMPRKRIVTKRYLYVHEFQEPIVRTPRPPSEYQKRRSYQILKHTPYEIVPFEDDDASSRSSESHDDNFGNRPRKKPTVISKTDDGNCSHSLHRFVDKDEANNLSPRESESYKCLCSECQCLREALADLKPDAMWLPPDYRHGLGKLRRDFDFLERKNYGTHIQDKQTEIRSHFVAMDVPQICDQLMMLVDNVIFRKEIVTSSLGHSYTTVTFSKGRTSQN